MLFWIFCILFVGAGVWLFCVDYWDDGHDAAVFTFVCAGVAIGISIVIMLVNFINIDGYVAAMHARREVLVYQHENDIYDNDNDIGKRELMKEIQDWNEDLSCRQHRQDDFWIGIYVPNIYDQFEPIKLERGTEQ